MHKVKIEKFEGPLDLLLQLIEDQKLEITEVALAAVTEQYIQILRQSGESAIQANDLADFLVIAAKLLLIKSRALLPFLQWEEEEEEEDLTKQLKIYKEYLEASKVIQSIISKKRFAFSREKILAEQEIGFSPPPKLKVEKLKEAMNDVIRALNPLLNLPTEVVKKTTSIQDKIKQIQNKIYLQASLSFTEVLKEANSRSEVIVSFLALLELMKQRVILVKQDKNFEDIEIQKL